MTPTSTITLSIPGLRGVIRLPDLRGFNRETGDTTIIRWRGQKHDIDGLIAWLRSQRIDYRESEESPGIHEVQSEFSNAQDYTAAPESPTETVWALETNDLEKPLTEHSSIASSVDFSTGYWQRAVADVHDNGADPSTYTGTFTDAASEALFLLAVKGVEAFESAQYVVRRTVTLDRDAPFSTYHPLANVNKVYTLAQMLSTFTDMPTNIQDCLDAIAGEYLYRGSSWEVSSQGRRQITDQWWHATTWSRDLYTAVT